ncbi:MAG: GTPase HflX [Candidatus Omnitrophica bacterium]|nr:GTPase HflX [Candidatus Omnitrophota bacterium]
MEKALLVTVEILFRKGAAPSGWKPEERAGELRELASSSGLSVILEEVVRRQEVSATSYIGKGKADELKYLCETHDIDVVVFNNDLSGSQQKNLEEGIGTKVIDRTQLILDIFARRAKSNEGKVQVELAQLMYLLPRLTGHGVEMSRMGGGIGTLGPGETKLEMDRRKINDRIARLTRELEDIKKQRLTGRKQRSHFSLLNIALIGYTNAGKSTLLNALTGSDVVAEDRLFSTLDPTIRTFLLPNNQKVILSDTVGFIHRLPHHLIESFKATLEEVREADLLVHVIDASHPKKDEHVKAVMEVLKELGADTKPMIQALNKIDRIGDEIIVDSLRREFGNAVTISALEKKGLEGLAEKIMAHLSTVMETVSIEVPHHDMKTIRLLYDHGHIIKKEYRGEAVYFEATIPAHLAAQLRKNKS